MLLLPTISPTRRWAVLWLTGPYLLWFSLKSSLAMTRRAMNDAILREIADFCRRTGVAESTFGRRAVNDGKLASRLRNGGGTTTHPPHPPPPPLGGATR